MCESAAQEDFHPNGTTSEDLAKCFSSREGSRSRLDDNTTSYLGGNSKVGKVQRILNVEEEVGQISHMSKRKNKIGLEWNDEEHKAYLKIELNHGDKNNKWAYNNIIQIATMKWWVNTNVLLIWSCSHKLGWL